MSRSVPWRNKPTQLITQMLPVANEYKLYLVHETGPTSFVFKDDNDNKFKVSIGDRITCSCGIVQNDQCIHTLYVLLKKFKVPPTNPIIWQASYLDSELEGFVQLKYAERKKEQKKKHQFKKFGHNAQTNQEADDFPVLQEDSMCPICYEQMNSECYSTCKTCKKSLHTKCFKVWTRHKEDSNVAVTCPMCRSEFQNPMVIIFKDIQKWEARFQTHKGTMCKGCGMKNIKGVLYKCLLCSGCQLCRLCFEGNQHPEHQRFVLKQLTNQSWKWAPIRIKKTKKQLFQPIKQTNIKELTNIQDDQSIIELFPTLKQYNASQQATELGIVGNQILPKQQCFKCRASGSEMMKRLNCGHSIHEQCLQSMISSKEFLCEIDNEVYCPGYFQAMGIKVAKSKKKPVECVITKNQEQINRINDKINNLEINGFVPKVQMPEKRNHSIGGAMNRSKDKNFRIMKKGLMQMKKKEDLLSMGRNNLQMIMITGFGHQGQNPVSQIRQQTMNLPPRMRSNINTNFR